MDDTLNPFELDYWRQELAFYGKPPAPKAPELKLSWFKIDGRCDDYLNKNFHTEDDLVPRMEVDRTLWMSLTPMETQSAYCAIQKARGRVITAGLGLGYFALRAAAKLEVGSVIVYEINPSLIAWFKSAFKDREGFDKISFVEGDARKTLTGQTADFVFVDIYDTLLPDEVVTDAELFLGSNKFKEYVFWGWEKVYVEAAMTRLIPKGKLVGILRDFVMEWTHAETDDGTALTSLYRGFCDEEYLTAAMQAVKLSK